MSTADDDDAEEAERPRTWLSTKQAAAHYGISLRTFEDSIRALRIPFYRPTGPRGERRFLRDELDAALRATRETVAD